MKALKFLQKQMVLFSSHWLISCGNEDRESNRKLKNESKAKRYRTVGESSEAQRGFPAVASGLSGKVGGHAEVQDQR
jgi:hypothetical protein